MVAELRRNQTGFTNRQLAHLSSLERIMFGTAPAQTVWRTALAKMYIAKLPDGEHVKHAKLWSKGPEL